MKKIFGIFGVFVIVGFVIVLIAGCAGSFSLAAQKSISEYRKNLFVAVDTDLGASFVTGKREEPYAYDGVSNELVQFGVLTVKFRQAFVGVNPSYTLYIDSFQYNGQLEFNPFDGTFVADIEKEFDDNVDVSLRLHAGGKDYDLELVCTSKDFEIDYKQAFSVAINAMQQDLQSYIKNGKLEGEIFIKFIGDNTMQLDTVYYFIYFVPKGNGEGMACMVDTAGNIVS